MNENLRPVWIVFFFVSSLVKSSKLSFIILFCIVIFNFFIFTYHVFTYYVWICFYKSTDMIRSAQCNFVNFFSEYIMFVAIKSLLTFLILSHLLLRFPCDFLLDYHHQFSVVVLISDWCVSGKPLRSLNLSFCFRIIIC